MDRMIFWSVRRINKTDKQKDLNLFLKNNKCRLVCLLETKVKSKNLGALYLGLFSGWALTSNSMYYPGGRIVLA